MQTKNILSIVLIATSLLACKKDLEPQESSAPLETAAVAPTTAPAANQAPAAPQQVQQIQPGQQPQPGQVITPTVTQAPPVKVAKGMNPSHGQPGHRCDIPVGAPLNSPPGKATAATPATPQMLTPKVTPNPDGSMPVTITPATIGKDGTLTTGNVTTTTTNNTPALLNPNAGTPATAPGMNPPHGQAGHRCDVAVGAPLPK